MPYSASFNSPASARPPLFYGWLIIAAAALIMFMGTGTMFSFGVFLKPIQQEFGWPRAAVSAAFAINWLMLAVSSLIFGAISDRSTRLVVLIGSIAFGVGLFLAARTTALWQLYVTFGALPGIATGAFYVPLVALATRWFTRRRGLAVGLISSGVGAGMVVMPRLSRLLMELYGLRPTLTIFSLAGIGIMVPLAFLLRTSPADMGLQPYGDQAASAGNTTTQPSAASTGKWHYLLKLPFPLIALTHLLCCTAHSGLQYHMIAFITDSGFARTTAAAIFSTWALASVGGRLMTGLIADRIGVRQTLSLMLGAQAVAISLYLLAASVTSFYLFGVFFGFVVGAVMPLYALVLREYYPPQIVGRIYGATFCVGAIGMGSGSFLGGLVFDLMGSYTPMFIIGAAVGGIALFTAAALPRPGLQPALLRAS
jgi:MFS family permease